MKIGFRTLIAISILLIVVGVIAIFYLLEPSAYLFSQNSQLGYAQVSTGNSTATQSVNVVPYEMKTTATASYCNCSDTQSDDG